jgi:hypothetical protein
MQIRLTADDKVALRAFWRFYQPRSLSISERTRASLSRSEAWSAAVSQTSRDESARQERESLVLQGRAILEDEWEPLLELWRCCRERHDAERCCACVVMFPGRYSAVGQASAR